MNKVLAIIAVVVLLVVQADLAESATNQWKDEQGVRHFSDQPPSDRTLPVAPQVNPKKNESSATEPALSPPTSPETEAKNPAVAESSIKATHEMIFGKWKPYSPQLRKDISEGMKADSGNKKADGLAGALGDAMSKGFVIGMMGSMRIEFTRDIVTTEMMGEKQVMRCSVVKIEGNAIIHVLGDSRISFQEEGKGEAMVFVRDDGQSQ